MEEIKVGEYCRTKNGQIYKIEDGTEFYEDSVNVGIGIIPDVEGIWVDKEHFTYVDKRDIVKHSPNLIDLIECGDYVNGYKVTNVINKEPCPSGKCVDIDADRPSEYCTLWEDNIESIVTKEQFENMEYKVEEQ